MKKNKGFTLIELLAVIAILAIILLIAVPMVLSTITSSKKASHEKSAMFAFEAAELYIATQTANGLAITTPATLSEIGSYLSNNATSNINAASFPITTGVISGVPTVTIENGVTDITCTWATPKKNDVTCTA